MFVVSTSRPNREFSEVEVLICETEFRLILMLAGLWVVLAS
jgi:hypothetical protein